MSKKNKKAVKHRPGTLEKRAMKQKLRKSPEWAELRKKIAEKQGNVDPVTLQPLRKGYNLHHLSQNDNYYTDLAEDRFVALSKYTHDTIHYLYNIYKREKGWTFLEEIKRIILLMEEITNADNAR